MIDPTITLSCSRCKREKPMNEFNRRPDRQRGYRSQCKECSSKREKARWLLKQKPESQTPEKKAALKESFRRYSQSPKGKRNTLKFYLRRLYGLSIEDYEAMIAIQSNQCAICGDNFSKQRYKPSVDHCHQTGKVRGLLCSPCNTAIGQMKDDPAILQKAIDYLNFHKT